MFLGSKDFCTKVKALPEYAQEEAYSLVVCKKGVKIFAVTEKGAFRAKQTLRMMELIDDEAFVNTSLVEVNLRVTEPFELGEDVFSEIHVTRLNVPSAGLSKFKKHPKWGKFGRITPTRSYWTVQLP